MANRSRISLLKGDFHSQRNTVIPLVTPLHPAITVLTRLTKQFFQEASESDSLLQYIAPPSDLIVAYSRLPNLQLLLCKNDQNSLINYVQPQRSLGYIKSSCNCDVCKASIFSPYVRSQSMPNYGVKIPATTSCKSGPAVIYYLCCKSKRPECRLAHYVGLASTSDPKKKPMSLRWSNHKSHFHRNVNKCKFTNHLLQFHRGEDPQTFCKIQILQEVNSVEEARSIEVYWTRKLFCYHPSGLNQREEEQ